MGPWSQKDSDEETGQEAVTDLPRVKELASGWVRLDSGSQV